MIHTKFLERLFFVFAPSLRVRINDLIPANDTIIVFEEQFKAGLQFPLDLFFGDVIQFHKLSVIQLHPNSLRILVAFRFICLNNNIKSSVALFSQLYQLGTCKIEEFWFFSGRKCQTMFDQIPYSLKRWKGKFFCPPTLNV